MRERKIPTGAGAQGPASEPTSGGAGGRVVWSAGIGSLLSTAEATYAKDMIQAENELLQHISETQLSETQPTDILRLAQEEIAQLQASLDKEEIAQIQAENELLQQLSDIQLTEVLRSTREELAQLQTSTDEEDVYECAYENYTAHTSPWSPCRDSDDERKANPGDLKDDSVL